MIASLFHYHRRVVVDTERQFSDDQDLTIEEGEEAPQISIPYLYLGKDNSDDNERYTITRFLVL
ncbi:hypothetical protein ALC60_02654 [Trachymyrmex zeteki]|uniref:Uncharacterized protein n=1 Tax=Mycetomoellerius zeteki TaxID=64791 RepID=A0A151XCY1_9HYME|nr:hypothetical protein ALC60_02654 [Trachymyrmex zeteki]